MVVVIKYSKKESPKNSYHSKSELLKLNVSSKS